MDRLAVIETFVSVSKAGSFSRAAEQLGMSRAAITKHIQDLEGQLGARLLNRTTRRVWPTDVGAAYLASCISVLGELDRAQAAVREFQSEVTGPLTILVPPSFASSDFATSVADFVLKYPAIEFNMVLGDSASHAFGASDGDFDLAIRLWNIPELAATVARKIGDLEWILCASSEFDQIAALRVPSDLSRVNCLIHPRLSPDRIWRFEDGTHVKVRGNFVTNSVLAIRKAALCGVGVAQLPSYYVAGDLRECRLVQVLPQHRPPPRPVYIVLPNRRFVPQRVHLFVEHFRSWFQQEPWLPRVTKLERYKELGLA